MRHAIYLSCLTLSACGGGGSSAPAAPAQQSAAGAWDGTVSLQGVVINDISCLAAETGEIACLLQVPGDNLIAGLVTGTVQTTGSTPSGSGRIHAGDGFTLSNGATISTFGITSGSVRSRQSLQMQISVGGQAHSIAMTYDSSYASGGGLSRVTGVYAEADMQGETSSLTIESNGEIFAQDIFGCVHTGQISEIDSRFNAYDIWAHTVGCAQLDGTYFGLALIENGRLWIAADNTAEWFFGQARQ